MSAKKARTPKRFRQKAWDRQVDKYADLSSPEWLTERLPRRFWEDSHNHTRYITWLAKELKIKSLDDWYRVSSKDITSRRGSGLLAYHGGSHIQFITSMIKRRNWYIWKFTTTLKGFWKKKSNRLKYLKWLEKELGIKKPEDWYQIAPAEFSENGGSGLLKMRRGESRLKLLRELYPDYEWLEWKFTTTLKGFWKKKSNRLKYLKWLEKELGFKKPEDWFQVEAKQINYSVFAKSGGKVVNVVRELYPDLPWKPAGAELVRSERKLQGRRALHVPDYYEDPENQRAFVEQLAKTIKIKSLDDWYSVSHVDFTNHHGQTLLNIFGGSRVDLLKAMYPKHEWKEWLFYAAPNGFWDDHSNRRRYMEWLGKRLGYKKMEDWYQLTQELMYKNSGSGLNARFHGTAPRVVLDCFPEFEWLPWKFVQVERGFWNDRKNKRRFMKWLEAELGYKKAEDWYKVTTNDFFRNYGSTLLIANHGKIVELLRELYPSQNWVDWQFSRVQLGFWDDRDNQLRYLEWLEKKLHIEEMEDWYEITKLDFLNNRGASFLKRFGDPMSMLQTFFPDFEWVPWKFASVPNGFWNSRENRLSYLTWLAKRLDLDGSAAGFIELTQSEFVNNFGGGILHYYGSILEVRKDLD